MLILGIDPGLTRTGIGLIRLDQRNEPELVHYEVIDSTAVSSTSSRLIFLYDRLSALIETYQPTESAMEKLFFQRNITTAVAANTPGLTASQMLEAWVRDQRVTVERTDSMLAEIRATRQIDLAMLTVAARTLRTLCEDGGPP